MVNWNNYRHFERSEFDSPDVEGSGDEMQEGFIRMLHRARVLSNTPFRINSGYRSHSHNQKVGGTPNSSHLKGCAADIHISSSVQRMKVLAALVDAGFRRIGIADTFIHVDNDPSKNDACWTY